MKSVLDRCLENISLIAKWFPWKDVEQQQYEYGMTVNKAAKPSKYTPY